MSTTEEELADEKQTQEESGVTQNGDEEKQLGDEPQMDERLAQGKTPNASVLSPSEIRDVSDETTIERHPADTHDAKNGFEANESKAEEAEAEPASSGVEDGWEDILGNGQLMKKVIGKGAGLSTRPTPQCRVKVRTRGYLESSKEVDRHSAVSFTVGDGDVPQAWDLVVPLMEKGETAKVKTNSRFAYGSLGKLPDIPPDANITYELELLDVQPPLNYETIAEEELLKLVDQKRVRGNELFQRKEYERAINSYQKGLSMIENFLEEQMVDSEKKTVQDMQIRCLNNLAAAQLKVELHKEALKSCEDVLQKDANNVKALFRAGKVLSILGEMDQAVRKLEKAKSLDSEERAIQTELEKAQQKRKVTQDKEKQMYRRMMEGGKPAKQQSKVAKPSISSWGPLPYLAVAAIVASIGIGLAYFITQKH